MTAEKKRGTTTGAQMPSLSRKLAKVKVHLATKSRRPFPTLLR
jgi:hypothetical protein